jgi:hypothetical protein
LYNRQKNDKGEDGDYGEVIQALNEQGYYEFDLLSWGSYAHLNSLKKHWGGDYSSVVNELLLLGSDASLKYVKIGSTGYSTFGATSAVNLYNVTGYAAKYKNGYLKLTPVTDVPANEGVIIEASEGTYGLPVLSEADPIDNDLLVSDGSVVGDGSTIFALGNSSDKGIGFYVVKTGVTVPAGKAYLVVSATAREFIGFADEETTGIADVKREVLNNNNQYYNLNGQRVAQPVKGLYIINGKKTIIK